MSSDNCPLVFLPFLQVWGRNVHSIQSLAPEYQHDLARVICGLDPIAQPLNPSISRIAAELRAVAIEISQRRTFQDRYAAALQAAIDSGDTGGGHSNGHSPAVKASFVPPPMYDPLPSPTATSPSGKSMPPSPFLMTTPLSLTRPLTPASHLQPPPTPTYSSSSGSHFSISRSPSPAPSNKDLPSPPSPSFFIDAPAIQLIRETLYASLADVLSTHGHIRRLLKRDPPRAYFSSVALAILDVARTRTSMASYGHREEVVVTGALGANLTLTQCPRELRPFMLELGMIGRIAQEMDDEDTMRAVEMLSRETDARRQEQLQLPAPRIERVQRILERGVGGENRRRSRDDDDTDDDDYAEMGRESGRRSVEGRAIAFANRINALALGMTKLRAFRERQDEVFKVLANVVS